MTSPERPRAELATPQQAKDLLTEVEQIAAQGAHYDSSNTFGRDVPEMPSEGDFGASTRAS